MSKLDPIEAHQNSIYHYDEIQTQAQCGCFYCLEIFNSQDIEEWIDDGKTAICPHCGIDTVIAETSDRPLTTEFLQDMNKAWF